VKDNVGQWVAFIMYMLITGIDVDIEVRSKNNDDKTGSAQKECNKTDGKNDSEETHTSAMEETHTSAMEVDDKHDKEANASRAERESPESEGWTVVNDATANQSMNLVFFLCFLHGMS
jgi:hypothetical protein